MDKRRKLAKQRTRTRRGRPHNNKFERTKYIKKHKRKYNIKQVSISNYQYCKAKCSVSVPIAKREYNTQHHPQKMAKQQKRGRKILVNTKKNNNSQTHTRYF